jgi:hypothetical protein
MGRLFRAWLCLVVAATGLVAPDGTAAADGSRSSEIAGLEDFHELRYRNGLRMLTEMGAPRVLTEMLAKRQSVDTDTFMYPSLVGDLNGNGSQDIIESEVTFSFDFSGQSLTAGEEAHTILRAREGKTGKKLWKREWDDWVFPAGLRLGEKGDDGVLVVGGLFSFFSTSPADGALTLDALSGGGKELWRKSYPSLSQDSIVTYVYQDFPLTLQRYDGYAGKAEDLILGLATFTGGLLSSTTATRVVTIDGRDGSDFAHPTVEIGLEFMPIPSAVADIDGDGFDDYAIANGVGIDLDESQGVPTSGGTLYVRNGRTGLNIWTESGLPLYEWAFPVELPQTVMSRVPDVGLVGASEPNGRRYKVHLFDGASGVKLWSRLGEDLFSVGDVDGDGPQDLFIESGRFYAEATRLELQRTVVRGNSEVLYKRKVSWDFEALPCPRRLCFSGGFSGSYRGGDVHPDRLEESLVSMWAYQDPTFEGSRFYVLDSRDGRTLFQSDKHVYAAFGSIDGVGSDLFEGDGGQGWTTLRALTGERGEELLALRYEIDSQLLDRSWYSYAQAADITPSSCSEFLFDANGPRNTTYYSVIDGGTGQELWSRWFGPKGDKLDQVSRSDSNRSC